MLVTLRLLPIQIFTASGFLPVDRDVKTTVIAESPEPLTQSFAGPRDISLNVFEQGLKFAVLGLRIDEVSILRLEISDLLATQDCAYQRSSLRYHTHKTGDFTSLVSDVRATPAWSLLHYAVQRSTWCRLSLRRENRLVLHVNIRSSEFRRP